MRRIIKFILGLSISIIVILLISFAIETEVVTGHSCRFENSTIENHSITLTTTNKGATIGTVNRYNAEGILGGYTINGMGFGEYYGILSNNSVLESPKTSDSFLQ